MKIKKQELFTERDIKGEILYAIRTYENISDSVRLTDEYHAKDIADIISELNENERARVLLSLRKDDLADILSYVEAAEEYLLSMPVCDAAAVIEHMNADDAADILDKLADDTRESILSLIRDEETKSDIDLISSYDDDEFGSRMSTDFISFRRDASVKEVMRELISKAPEYDNVYTLFVENEDGSFYGAIALKDLISARSGDPLESVICTTFPFVYDTDLISENLERIRSYLEELIPVISSSDGSIIGVITSSDVTDMIDEEIADDYAKLAALSEEEEENESTFKSIKKRVPWLIALLFLGLTVSSVVGLFEGVVNEIPVIVAFQSLILGMAGNVGTQSLAVTVRVLGSKNEHKKGRYIGSILRETRIAFINGAVIGGASFITVGGYLLLFSSYDIAFMLSVAGCVGAAMCISMMISGFTGASVPICIHLFGADPAIASGPLITTISDLCAVVSYYGLSWMLLTRFAV